MDVISVDEQYYILASSSLARERTCVLKQGDSFGIFDCHGDIRPRGVESHGIFHDGCRYLSRFTLTIDKKTPLLLSSTVKEDNDLLTVDMTNPDFIGPDGELVKRGQLHIGRSIFLWKAACFEKVIFTNFGHTPVSFSASFRFEADCVDIFEVRGVHRAHRGKYLPSQHNGNETILGYVGLDDITRHTRVHFETQPTRLDDGHAQYALTLAPRESFTCALRVSFEKHNGIAVGPNYDDALRDWRHDHQEFWEGACRISTSNASFNEWIERSNSDLAMMLTRTAQGRYPYAGIPWFSTVFGRDGIICALQTLWNYPAIAEGVLRFLAAHQASSYEPERDAEPGKILHEVRSGEMAALNEIPFGKYYGSVDSTPLFLLLAGRYFERTGNKRFMAELWPHIERALSWIETDGDLDHDGFIEYQRRSSKGLLQHGWRDSDDAVFHADGSNAVGPLALCEVQGYVYEARLRAAQIAAALGKRDSARAQRDAAKSLRRRFHEAFWLDDLSTYALALDGEKRPCRVRSSCAGQCLYTGIAVEHAANQLVQGLMSDDFYSGWGVRTIATTEARYNPMSYHNGSVWPHDNALIAAGLARYGHKNKAAEIFNGMYEVSRFIELCRLPELFCGFTRRDGEGPIFYPVACTPQAWASAAIFMFLESCLGLNIVAHEYRVVFHRPILPGFLDEVVIENLRVNDASVDVQLRRHVNDVGVNVIRRDGNVEVVAIK